jgi:hypothetical protein
MHFTIEDSVVDGDRVWVRVRGRDTNTGAFFGPPSGQPVDITVFDQARVLDGRIVEHWGVPDRSALLMQTGVLARIGSTSPGTDDGKGLPGCAAQGRQVGPIGRDKLRHIAASDPRAACDRPRQIRASDSA